MKCLQCAGRHEEEIPFFKDGRSLSVWEMGRKMELYTWGLSFLPLILEDWHLQGPLASFAGKHALILISLLLTVVLA